MSNGNLQLTLLGQTYGLTKGEHVLNYMVLLTDKVNAIAEDLVKHGKDIHEGAARQRAIGEWLRVNQGSAAAVTSNGGVGALAALGLAGFNQTTAQQVTPQPVPQPTPQPANPHKTATPQLNSKNPIVIDNNGSINMRSGHTPSDLVMQIAIANGTQFIIAGQLVCSVAFGAAFTRIPNVQLTQQGPNIVGNLYPTNVSLTGFDIVTGQALPANEGILININVSATAGDATY